MAGGEIRGQHPPCDRYAATQSRNRSVSEAPPPQHHEPRQYILHTTTCTDMPAAAYFSAMDPYPPYPRSFFCIIPCALPPTAPLGTRGEHIRTHGDGLVPPHPRAPHPSIRATHGGPPGRRRRRRRTAAGRTARWPPRSRPPRRGGGYLGLNHPSHPSHKRTTVSKGAVRQPRKARGGGGAKPFAGGILRRIVRRREGWAGEKKKRGERSLKIGGKKLQPTGRIKSHKHKCKRIQTNTNLLWHFISASAKWE